jgi:NCS2 family nucleobase:cation symporter-2/xanthine permease XanP
MRAAPAFYGLEEPLPLHLSFLLGLQHVLAMFVGIVTPPLIIAGALKLPTEEAAFLISMSLLMSGVTTFLQVRRLGPLGSGLLSVQGTSFVFVPLAIQAGTAGGLALVFGMAVACAPWEMLISRSISLAQRLFPPVVTGAVVMLIGVGLIGVGMNDLAGGFGAPDFGAPRNLGLGLFVMVVIVMLNRFSSGFLRTVSIAVGLVAGYAVAAAAGLVDLSVVERARWFTAPQPLRYGLHFEAAYLLPWLLGYTVTSIECIGDLTASSVASREPVVGPVFFRRLQGGVLADGVGCFLAGLLNCLPTTTFAQNNGVIAMTGVASRRVGLAVAALLAGLGLFPKMAALISVMPHAVLGGATVIMFAMVAVAGLNIVVSERFGPREQFILSITLGLGIGVDMVPGVGTAAAAALANMPGSKALGEALQVVLHSGLALGAVVAILLNLLLPAEPTEPATDRAQH